MAAPPSFLKASTPPPPTNDARDGLVDDPNAPLDDLQRQCLFLWLFSCISRTCRPSAADDARRFPSAQNYAYPGNSVRHCNKQSVFLLAPICLWSVGNVSYFDFDLGRLTVSSCSTVISHGIAPLTVCCSLAINFCLAVNRPLQTLPYIHPQSYDPHDQHGLMVQATVTSA